MKIPTIVWHWPNSETVSAFFLPAFFGGEVASEWCFYYAGAVWLLPGMKQTHLQSIAARAADGPCCDWIGPAGSAHFVKTTIPVSNTVICSSIAEVYLGDEVLPTKNNGVHRLPFLPTGMRVSVYIIF